MDSAIIKTVNCDIYIATLYYYWTLYIMYDTKYNLIKFQSEFNNLKYVIKKKPPF